MHSLIRNQDTALCSRRRLRSRECGHTLLELMVVVGIMMVVSALALPTMVNVIANTKVRTGMHDLASIFQTCRQQAVKQNSIKSLNFTVKNGSVVAYIDAAANPEGLTANATVTVNGVPMPQAQVWLPSTFTRVAEPTGGGGSPTALDANAMWGSSASDYTPITTAPMYFNQVGLPCIYSSGTCPIANPAGTGYVYYFTYKRSLGSPQWAAIGVSPAGRIKTWYWDGGAWSN